MLRLLRPRGEAELRTTAERHYYRSVKLLRRSLNTAGEREADVVLACTMVLIACGLALAGGDGGGEFSLWNWACRLRGWQMIGASIYGEVDASSRLIPYPRPGIPEDGDLPERSGWSRGLHPGLSGRQSFQSGVHLADMGSA